MPFGPPVYVGQLDKPILRELQNSIDIVRGDTSFDFRSRVVGRVNEQYYLGDVCSEQVYDHLERHLSDYINGLDTDIIDVPNFSAEDMYVDALWVNIQKDKEYNPRHHHIGLVSFVLYTRNDLTQQEALDNEHDIVKNDDLGGVIEFRYGENLFMNSKVFSHYPKEGDILMFPSWLQHHVHSFFQEGKERHSVAGNFFIRGQGPQGHPKTR